MDLAATVFALAAAAANLAVMAWMMRGIIFEGPGTDGELQVDAAAQARSWRWPSGMHRYTKEKARMKDMGLLMLVIMQRLLGDRNTFYPLAVGCALAHSITAVLVFLVASAYWSTGVGLVLFGLYLACLWPHMIILQGGYQGLSVMFLLFSVYFLQMAEGTAEASSGIWVLLAGAAFAAMVFSSASSRKLIPLALAAFIFSQAPDVSSLGIGSLVPESTIDWGILWLGGSLIACLAAFRLSIKFGLPDRLPQLRAWKNIHAGAVPNKSITSIQGLFVYGTGQYVGTLINLILVGVLYLVPMFLLLGSPEFYAVFLWWFVGGGLVVLALTFPNVAGNLRGYYWYYIQTQHGGHYYMYDNYFKQRIGKTLREGDGGLRWYPGYFWRIIPFHSVGYAVAVTFLVYAAIAELSVRQTLGLLAIAVLSLSPMIWSELTKGSKAAFPYFPAFIGLLLPIGQAIYLAAIEIPANYDRWMWISLSLFVAASAWRNLWVVSRDVLPARMAVSNFIRKLDDLGINEFYTYDTPYNAGLVGAIPLTVKDQYGIHYIEGLSGVKQGYVVVPGTSSKASSMEGSQWAIQHGDFGSDSELTRLIESRQIEHYAVAWFKTFGTSRHWVQVYDVPSYRDLILKEVGEEDRYRGRAWILDGAKLHAERNGE